MDNLSRAYLSVTLKDKTCHILVVKMEVIEMSYQDDNVP